MNDRVLPTYIVCDTSESMEGEAIQQVNLGLANLIQKIRAEEELGHEMRLCIIEFNTEARVAFPMQKVDARTAAPTLRASGITKYNKALTTLGDQIKTDYQAFRTNRDKVVRPVVFFFTDGVPSDDRGYPLENHSEWTNVLETTQSWNLLSPRIFAFGFGNANEEILQRLTRDRDYEYGKGGKKFILATGEATGEYIQKFFGKLFATLVDAQEAGSKDNLSMKERDQEVEKAIVDVINENIDWETW